jgi:uncharacterized BrkB/YihY/UPF0761 family membrane protein
MRFHRWDSQAQALHGNDAVFETLPLSWSELARRTWREALDDDILGLAAQLAYYQFLALFPAILFLLALASFFPLASITDDVARSIGPFVSPQVLELIQDQMRRLGEGESGGLLTFGVAGALWSSSAAMVSIVGALNRAYDIKEGRPWWKVRLVSIGLTVGASLLCSWRYRSSSSDRRWLIGWATRPAGVAPSNGRGWARTGAEVRLKDG